MKYITILLSFYFLSCHNNLSEEKKSSKQVPLSKNDSLFLYDILELDTIVRKYPNSDTLFGLFPSITRLGKLTGINGSGYQSRSSLGIWFFTKSDIKLWHAWYDSTREDKERN